MFEVRRLDPQLELTEFDCGVASLNLWLRRHALKADRMGTARTYAWVDWQGKVGAYFSLAPHLVSREDVPRKVGRDSPDRIPAILLARLALDRRWHGKGMGAALLVDALTTAVEAARQAGGRLIVVDAIDEGAARFYRRHDFQPSPDNPFRLIVKVSEAAKTLGLPWP